MNCAGQIRRKLLGVESIRCNRFGNRLEHGKITADASHPVAHEYKGSFRVLFEYFGDRLLEQGAGVNHPYIHTFNISEKGTAVFAITQRRRSEEGGLGGILIRIGREG